MSPTIKIIHIFQHGPRDNKSHQKVTCISRVKARDDETEFTSLSVGDKDKLDATLLQVKNNY